MRMKAFTLQVNHLASDFATEIFYSERISRQQTLINEVSKRRIMQFLRRIN